MARYNLTLDTNIVVSSVIGKPGSPPRLIVRTVMEGQHRALVSTRLLKEYQTTFQKPKLGHLPRQRVARILSFFETEAERINSLNSLADLPDPDDNHVLDCAVAGAADFLITGNKRHFPMDEFEGVRIITAREFVQFAGLAETSFNPAKRG